MIKPSSTDTSAVFHEKKLRIVVEEQMSTRGLLEIEYCWRKRWQLYDGVVVVVLVIDLDADEKSLAVDRFAWVLLILPHDLLI